jgi:hypothetical protein
VRRSKLTYASLRRGGTLVFVALCVEHFMLSAPLVAALRRGGLSVTTGTVNDRVLRFGPDALTTDVPHALRGGVRSRAA